MKTIFVQPQYAPQSAQVVAEAIGGKVVPINGLGERTSWPTSRTLQRKSNRTAERVAADDEEHSMRMHHVEPEPVISLRDVTFSYGGAPALEDVNLSVDDREAVCIVGPNGGGKTTLVKLILGLLSAAAGRGPRVRPAAAAGSAARRLHAAARAARSAVPRHGDGHRADGPAGQGRACARH